MTTEQNNDSNTPDELDEQNPPASTEADAQHIDPEQIAEHLDKENAERHEQERADAEPPLNEARHGADDAIARFETVSDPKHLEIADEYVADAQAIARDSGIPAQAVEAVLHYVLGEHASAVEADRNAVLSQGQIPGVKLNDKQSTMNYMRKTYGTMADTIVSQAQAAFRSLPKDVQNYLDHDSGDGQLLTNSPHLLVALALHHSGFTKLDRAGAEREIAGLQKGKLDALGLAKLKIARHVASRGKSTEDAKLSAALKAKAAAKPAPTVQSKLEAELKQIRLDPGYYKRDAGNHKALVARVNAIYAELHPERA